MNVRQILFENQDLKFKEFHERLVPNIEKEKIIGVRIPILRKIAKSLDNNNFSWDFYEEVMLHGLYIGYGKDTFEEKLMLLDKFIPKIDNWAICDSVVATLKFINENKIDFFDYLSKYFYSSNEYDVRFAIVVLMNYYLDDNYIDFYLDYLKDIKSDYYYVNMAAAWAFSAAFVKYQQSVMEIIESGCLTPQIHNMTISKINDSLRVDADTKKYVKSLKR